ncbi:cDP-diacylglycerol-glycerol-3-phosphate 3-phosphatidyltransferase [Ruminococcus sp. CAG:488]|jgi:cardiolipin synthase|nr:cDP-diacylglycerol-glycerol-3-phosphate 3-phosphatidyltransferase [Ruminococcus sp. CAG:488]
MVKDLFKNWNTIPNWLSFARIIMVPVFAYLFLNDSIPNNIIWAVFVLALSGLSDCLDGKIARRFNQISDLGKVLDPVADKLTQITIAVLLYIRFSSSTDSLIKTFSWIFLVFIIKEFVMVLFGGIMIAIGLKPSAAEIYGKVATCVFYFVMIALFAFAPDVGAFNSLWTIPDTMLIVLVAISALLTVVAFVSYLPGVFKQFKEKISKK